MQVKQEKETATVVELPLTLTVSVISSISQIPADHWDACALDSTGPESANPFITHAFLSSLEDSKSAVPEEGWLPQHLVARHGDGSILGVVPLYLKSHSYGEYVFDHSWANAFYRYGGAYYPKLQSCVPFTPATGPRMLVRNGPFHDQVFDGLCKCMQQLTGQVCVQICYWVSLCCFLHFKASMGVQMHRSFLLSFVFIQDCSSYMTSTGKISM
jgi:predicted N-acyltransferase